MAQLKAYLLRVGDALSQLVNTAVFNGHPNESISGRAWRTKSIWYKVIDSLFWFDYDHCRVSHENDLAYARKLLNTEGK